MTLGLPVGQHIYLSAKVNGELVERRYTPTSNERDQGFFDLVVKIYFKDTNPKIPEGGKLTQHLDKLKIGECIDIRGPAGLLVYGGEGRFAIKPDPESPPEKKVYRKIGMVAGGTGITPMLQLIREVFYNERDQSKIYLIFANQSPSDILLREELEYLAGKFPNRFHLHYTVSRKAPKDWEYSTGYVSEAMVREHLPAPADDVIVLMCGRPAMMTDVCLPLMHKMGYKNYFKY